MTSKLVSVSVVMALVPTVLVAVLVAVAGTASATAHEVTDKVAAESVSYGLAGPVGIAAVVIGIGGLVIGLLRHRRRVVGAVAAMTGTQPAVEQAAGEHVA
jgi:hypothetical protein